MHSTKVFHAKNRRKKKIPVASTYLKEVILWFIGGGSHAEVGQSTQAQTIRLERAKPKQAPFNEIYRFLNSLPYVKPYSRPSKRAVYKWLNELEAKGLVKTVQTKKSGKGRPKQIYMLTENGEEKRLLINERFKGEGCLTGSSDILFTMGPNREYLTLHVLTRDKELIELVWKEVEGLTKDSGLDLRGRKGHMFLKNHQLFKKIGNTLFLCVYSMLKLRTSHLPSENKYSNMVQNALKLFPFLQAFINSEEEEKDA